MLRNKLSAVRKTLRRNRLIGIGASITLLVIMTAIVAPYIVPHCPMTLDPMNRLQPPSSCNWLGTDELGRDVLTRVILGARLSLQVGMSVVVISAVIGGLIGLCAGFFRAVDAPIMRVMDGFLAMPGLLVAIALMASLGPSVRNVIVALSISSIPRMARLLRSSVLVVREMEFVVAAQALGVSLPRLLFRHVLPNCLSPLIVQTTFVFAVSVLSEASLSFLGVGVPPYIPSWGTILAGGRQFMRVAPWLTIFPGISIVLTVMGLNLLGDGARDLLDPRLRKL